MFGLTPIEETQMALLKRELFMYPSGIAVYPRELLRKHGQQPYARVVRRLVEEVMSGQETTIRLQYPKADAWKIYWISGQEQEEEKPKQ